MTPFGSELPGRERLGLKLGSSTAVNACLSVPSRRSVGPEPYMPVCSWLQHCRRPCWALPELLTGPRAKKYPYHVLGSIRGTSSIRPPTACNIHRFRPSLRHLRLPALITSLVRQAARCLQPRTRLSTAPPVRYSADEWFPVQSSRGPRSLSLSRRRLNILSPQASPYDENAIRLQICHSCYMIRAPQLLKMMSS